MSLFDRITPEQWACGLPTGWAGKGLLDYHEQLPSTNSRLKELAKQGAPEGSLCICHSQTAGRGRLQRSWLSAAGETLTFSLLLKPSIAPEHFPLCTFAAALAVCDAVRQLCPPLEPLIKWPNDIVLEGKKCTGILSELVYDPAGNPCVVMGVGINVAQHSFPEEIARTATSLVMAMPESGSAITPSPLPLLAAFLESMEASMDMLSRDPALLLAACAERSATLKRRVNVIGREENFTGTAEAMDETGALLVRDESGSLRRVLSGDVSVRGLMGYI